jgi:hypothetical protein
MSLLLFILKITLYKGYSNNIIYLFIMKVVFLVTQSFSLCIHFFENLMISVVFNWPKSALGCRAIGNSGNVKEVCYVRLQV